MKTKIFKPKIKKGDSVVVIAGKDKGKEGKVEKVLTTKGKIVVSGINLVKKHLRPTSKNPKGGVLEIPAALDISNVMLKCPSCHKPTRISYIYIKKENLKKSLSKKRICKKCNQQIDKE